MATPASKEVVKEIKEVTKEASEGLAPKSLLKLVHDSSDTPNDPVQKDTKENKTTPAVVATREEDKDQDKDKRPGIKTPGFLGRLAQQFFKVEVVPDAQTQVWADQFAWRAKGNFKGYDSATKFAQEIVQAKEVAPHLAKDAEDAVYKIAKGKGFDTTEIEAQVTAIEAEQKLLPQVKVEPDTAATPDKFIKLYDDAEIAESSETRTIREMEASIASVLGLLDPENPTRARAEEVLRGLKDGNLHELDQSALEQMIVNWIPEKVANISEPERELIQTITMTAYRVGEDHGISTDEMHTNVTRGVLNRWHQHISEITSSLTPTSREINPNDRVDKVKEKKVLVVDVHDVDKVKEDKLKGKIDPDTELLITQKIDGDDLGDKETLQKVWENRLTHLPEEQRTKLITKLVDQGLFPTLSGGRGRIRGDDPAVMTMPTTEDRDYERDNANNDQENLNFWQEAWEEIRKSPEIGEGPSRKEINGRKLDALEKQLEALTDKDDIEAFLSRRLRSVWNENFADVIAKMQSTHKTKVITEDGREETQTVFVQQEYDAKFSALNQKYQIYIDEALKNKDTNSVQELKHQADQVIQVVMKQVLDFQEDAAVNAKLEKELQRPENIADFGKLIMRSNPIKWGSRKYLEENPHYVIGPDGTRRRIRIGENPMFDDNDRLVEGNVMLWLTDRIRHLNDENPDEQISFFSAIDIDLPGMWRPIQVGSLLRHRGFFTDQDGIEMPHLYNEVTNLVWLIGYIRNADVLMRQGFLDQKKIVGVLQQLFLTNTLTKGSLGPKTVLEWFFTMPEKFIEKADPKDLDAKIGNAIATAFLTYYNVTDFEYLQENLGDLQMFMTGRGVQRALAYAINGSDDLEFTDNLFNVDNDETQDKLNKFLRQSKLKGSGKSILDLFNKDASGNLTTFIDSEENRRAFVDFINPYAPYKKNQKALTFLRRLVEQGAAERAGLFKLGEAAKVVNTDAQISERENALRAKWGVLSQGSGFAEMTAYFMGYPLGAGTRGQTGVEAINFLEKVTRPYFYQKKLESIERAGATGNRFTFGLLRGSFIDIVTGVPAVEGESISEILEKQMLVRQLELEGRRTGTSAQKLEEALQKAILTDEERGEVRRQIARKRNAGIIGQIRRKVGNENLSTIDQLGRDINRFEARATQLEQEVLDYRNHAQVLRDKDNKLEAEVLEAKARALQQEAQEQYDKRDQKIAEAMGYVPDEERASIQALTQQENYAELFKIITLNVASRLQFNRNDSQTHVTQWENAIKLYDNVIHGKEVEYSKFIKTTPFGYEIDQVGLQENIKNEWITPTRYTFSTNKMPMNKMRRNLDDNVPYDKDQNYKFETRPLVEELFNRQVLSVAQKIWTYEMEHPYTSKLKKASAKFKGKTFLDPETGYIKRKNGNQNELDPEVNAMLADDEFNRIVYKAFLLCKFGGDLYSHTKLRTGAPHFRFGQREQAIAALANITAGIHDDDLDMTNNEVYNYFFTKHDIRLLRRISHNQFWKGFSKELGIEGGLGFGEGFLKGLGKVINEIFK